jgi:putative endonuclease
MGETCAADWYHQHEYKVLARNWRCRSGEIDLVATKDGVLVISEVKTRSSSYFGPPSCAVDHTKQRRLRRLAVMWLAECPGAYRSIRFDVVEVLVEKDSTRIAVIEAAF